MAHYLVVAHQTADSEELVEKVRELAEEASAEFTLLVPATPVDHLATWSEGESRAMATKQAERARIAMEGVGANIVATEIGDPSPFEAVRDRLLHRSYDSIVVSTFPLKTSRWLKLDVIHRLERAVDVPIVHVVSHSKS